MSAKAPFPVFFQQEPRCLLEFLFFLFQIGECTAPFLRGVRRNLAVGNGEHYTANQLQAVQDVLERSRKDLIAEVDGNQRSLIVIDVFITDHEILLA